MDDSPPDSPPASKLYIGFIWVGEEPGVRLRVVARTPDEAMAAVEAEYGTGHVISLWNEEGAARPHRGAIHRRS